MDNLNQYRELEKLLRNESKYCTEDGHLLKNAIVEAALAMRPDLLRLLLSHEALRNNFFTEVDGVPVFDKVKFQKFVMNKRFLPDSYTCFKNKVGITDAEGDNYLSESREVVLSWPYKDCMLEGGQTKEDAKRNEVFWNEILAPDEINRLTEPKALNNFRCYDAEGEHEVTNVSKEDNFIIKGNNLLALYSLKKIYAGKVKLIYIDPPYYFSANRDEDTFQYNSNFKLSTWLTFMKNRLTVARELLSDDGAIFVQISDDGVAELHRLMKDVFNKDGVNNFINKITIKTKSPSGFASVNAGLFETAEYIIGFAKNKSNWTYNTQYVKSNYDSNYKYVITNKTESYQSWKFTDIETVVAIERGFEDKIKAKTELGKMVFDELVSEYATKHGDTVFRYTAINSNAGQDVLKAKKQSESDPDLVIKVERVNKYAVFVHKAQEMAFYSKKLREIEGEIVPSIQLSNIWTDVPYEGIAREGDVQLKGGKKPERLIKRIIEMSTNTGDLVLDYHIGSGTTTAVAHKLKRKYIGIEQLDSMVEKSIHRLSGVIKSDQTGISKSINWQGGGSFVYCELATANQRFVDAIEKATSTDELQAIWTDMQATGFLSWKVKPQEIDENIKDFAELSLDDQKRFLIECLDKNLLYVPYSEINNEEFGFGQNDKILNSDFYSIR